MSCLAHQFVPQGELHGDELIVVHVELSHIHAVEEALRRVRLDADPIPLLLSFAFIWYI